MTWFNFGTQTSPEPMSNLDVQFGNVAQWASVDCTASGTNVITLTPSLSGYTAASYANFVSFRFAAANNSTGAVTLKVGSQAALNVYKVGGTLQVGNGDIIAGQVYLATYQASLNSAAGGWYLTPMGGSPLGTVVLINVRAYGAKGDGSSDDTSAVLAATAAAVALSSSTRGACIYFPAGGYVINTNQWTITANNISVQGDGIGASFIFPANDNGDALYVHPTSGSGGALISRFCMRDITFYTLNDTTSGASVHLDRINGVFFTNVELAGHYGSLRVTSVVVGEFGNLQLSSDSNFPSLRANSYLLRFDQYAAGPLPASVFFSNLNCNAQNNNNFLDYGIYIAAADGIYITNGTAYGAKTAGIVLAPATDSTQMSSVHYSGAIDTCQTQGLKVIEPSGSYTGTFGDHNFHLKYVYNCGIGVTWNCAATDRNILYASVIFHCGTDGIDLTKGSKLKVLDAQISDLNVAGSGAVGIKIGASFTDFEIINAMIARGPGAAIATGMTIANGADYYTITNLRFMSCTADLTDSSTTTHKSINYTTNASDSQYFITGTSVIRLDGAGNVIVNTAAIATNATDGFLYVPSCAGTPTGTPTTYTGRVPLVVNTTNNKLYFYSSGAWRDAGP